MRSIACFSFIGLSLLFATVTGCAQRVIHGDGSDYKESRTLSAFDKVHNSTSSDVILVKGDSYSVKIEGEQNIVAVLVTEVRDHELHVEFPFLKNIRTTKSLRIVITTPTLSGVSNSGSGRIRAEDSFKSASMSVYSSGSGRVELVLDAGRLELGMSGSGGMLLKGHAGQLECRISGSGRVDGAGLAVKDRSEIHVSGSGSCTIATDGEIDGGISGSGGINYKGTPASVNISHSGSGRARKID